MNKTLILNFIIGFFILQVGCRAQIDSQVIEPTETDLPKLKLTSTLMIKTQMATSETVPLNPTSTNRQQLVTTVTSTYSLAPTIIPSPLPVETAQALIAELLITNANCRLPCWWGITPGQTNWNTASQLMDQIGKGKYSSSGWWYYLPNLENQTYINQHFIVLDNIVNMIEVTFGNAYFLSLSELLMEYGPPSEIYIRTFSNEHQGIIPFYILLFYADQGILARYESYEARIVANENIQICFTQDPMWGIVLWDPNYKQTYLEIVEIAKTVGIGGSEDSFLPLHTIGEAANLSPNSFYNVYRDLTNIPCLETPSRLWPGQFE